jgi:PPE-repeat protein
MIDFSSLPPEINSARMYSGAGSASMQAAGAAWNQLAAEMRSAAASYSSVVSGLTDGSWLGPASASMADAAAPYAAWMHTTAAQAEQTAAQARAAATAYEAAFSTTVPPAAIATNRAQLTSLIANNVLGQNAPAIAATEAQYGDMWAQDAAAMYGYAGAAATASALAPFSEPPPTTNGGAQQAAVVSQGARVINAIPQALQALATSTAATPQSADVLSDLTPLIPLITVPIAATGVGTSSTSISTGLTGIALNVRGFQINADRDYAQHKGPFTGWGPGAANLPNWFFHSQGYIAAPSDAVESSVYAGLGEGTPVGRLSVPAAWTVAAPGIRPAAFTIPITNAAAAPEVAGPGNLFSSMGLAGAAGGAVGSTASAGRGNERVRITPRKSPTPAPQPPTETVAAIATELQELATRAQSLLSKLAESGLLTTDQVAEQKRRFTV